MFSSLNFKDNMSSNKKHISFHINENEENFDFKNKIADTIIFKNGLNDGR